MVLVLDHISSCLGTVLLFVCGPSRDLIHGDFEKSHCSTSQRLVTTRHYNTGRIALREPLFVMSRGHAAYVSNKVMMFN